jgi:gamma-glutamylcyclotransferase (GGCT)/AIG2-like uncharacterized protein YtfP
MVPAIDAEGRAVDRIALYGSLMRGLGTLESLGVASALHFEGSCALPGQLFDLGSYPGLRQHCSTYNSHGDSRPAWLVGLE